MKIKLFHSLILITGLLLMGIFPASAQTDLDTLYVASDGTYEIYFPDGWEVDDSDGAFTVISGFLKGNLMTFTVFSPNTIALFAIGESSAVGVLENLIADDEINFIEADAEATEVDGRDAAIASVQLESDPGFVYVIEMEDGDYGMVIILGDEKLLNSNTAFIEEVIATYNSTDEVVEGGGNSPRFLENYNLTWQEATQELHELGLIGTGGSLVFNEPSAFFSGQGYFFTPLGRTRPFADIVMAAEIEFTSSTLDDYEECSLLARLVDTGGQTVNTYLQVGLDNEGYLFYFDTEGRDATDIYEFFATGADLSEPVHLLFLLQDETLTVYVDGQLVFDQVATNDERSGSYGIALLGKGRDARCEGTNIWVYQAPSFEPGFCEVSTNGNVNKRSGPGTTFDRAGTLEAGTVMQVVAQSAQSDGIWWQLDDDSWVREDVVSVTGDCANVPESDE